MVATIEEVTEVLRAGELEGRRLTIRTYQIPSAPRSCGPDDLERVGELPGASQEVLARFLG
jgi:hypothetical protein